MKRQPVPDVDAVILMATTLSSKRRPAMLVEIVAAAEVIQGFVPYADKLGDAIARLSGAGLICASSDGFTLTPAGETIMGQLPRKAATEDLLIAVLHDLAAHSPKEACAAIVLSEEELGAAILTYKTSRKGSGKNLLMPKPKPDRHFKVEGRWRRAQAKR